MSKGTTLYQSCKDYWDGFLSENELIDFTQALVFNLDEFTFDNTIDDIRVDVWEMIINRYETTRTIPVLSAEKWAVNYI